MNQKKTAVLIIGINFYPEPTGIGKYTADFAFYLAKKAYKVKVITGFPYYPHWKVFPEYKNLFYKREHMKRVSVTRCPLYVPSSLSGIKRMLQDASFFATAFLYLLTLMIRRKKYNLVFIPSPSFMSGFLGLFYRFFFRKTKLVYHVQDLQIDAAEELGIIKSPLLLRSLKKAEGVILSSTDWVTTISAGMQKKISDKSLKMRNQCLFPNWADLSSFAPRHADELKLQHLGFPLYKRMVFYSGAVGEKQGLEAVIEIACKAMNAFPELVFVISGSGPYVKKLETLAEEKGTDNLYFISLQPANVFNELLNHAFIHLVIQKGKAGDLLLPSKLTNILAVGGLSIVTAEEGTTLYDIVAGNNMGVVVAPENSEALWKALAHLCSNPVTISTIKSNAFLFAQRNLRKENVIDSFLKEISIQYN